MSSAPAYFCIPHPSECKEKPIKRNCAATTSPDHSWGLKKCINTKRTQSSSCHWRCCGPEQLLAPLGPCMEGTKHTQPQGCSQGDSEHGNFPHDLSTPFARLHVNTTWHVIMQTAVVSVDRAPDRELVGLGVISLVVLSLLIPSWQIPVS